MGCLGVCGPARARRVRQCSDRMGSAVLVLGLGTIFPMGIPDSFIPQQQPRKTICQGFRRWKVKSDIMDDANERTNDGTANANSRPTNNQRRSIARRDECGLGWLASKFGLGRGRVGFVSRCNEPASSSSPSWCRVETVMATQRSEHVRHLQWSRLAGLRRRERAEEGPDADEVSARRKRGVGSFGSFVAGFRRGGCEEGEAERAVRGIGKRKGNGWQGTMRGIRVSLIGRALACWSSYLIPSRSWIASGPSSVINFLSVSCPSVPAPSRGAFFFVFFSVSHTPFSSPRAVNQFRFQPQSLFFFLFSSLPLRLLSSPPLQEVIGDPHLFSPFP